MIRHRVRSTSGYHVGSGEGELTAFWTTPLASSIQPLTPFDSLTFFEMSSQNVNPNPMAMMIARAKAARDVMKV